MRTLAIVWLLCAVAAEACGAGVTGAASYRERVALPPGAVFEATLDDVSRADARAETLGQARLEAPGNPPIRFAIEYDEAKLNPAHRYAVRAKVLLDGRLLFTSDRIYPVLTQGHGNTATILLRAVPAAQQPKAGGLGQLPASFEGDLPCADCPGIRYHLDLFPDRVYYLRMDYLERGLAFDSLGHWILSGDERLLSLAPNRQTAERFAVEDRQALRKLDAQGQEIATTLNYELKRLAAFQPIEPRLRLRGLYSYMADAGLFIECGSHLRLPVATEQDNAALEAAYGNTRLAPGERLVVEVEGQIAPRPKMEGEGAQPTLIVERFLNLSQPGETCGGPEPNAELQETLWELTHLGEAPLKLREKQRPPSLILRRDLRVGGFGGCNRLIGGYTLDGGNLSFGKMASTLMACPPGRDTEQLFQRMLERVKAWKIDGERLELFGVAGKPLARFESRYLR